MSEKTRLQIFILHLKYKCMLLKGCLDICTDKQDKNTKDDIHF